MYNEKTDLEKALDRFQGFNEAYGNTQKNFATLRDRAEELAEKYDFLTCDGREDTFFLDVNLGSDDAGRIVVNALSAANLLEFGVGSPLTRESVTIRAKRNSDNLFVTTMKEPGNKNPYGIEEGRFVNKSYIDYLVTQLVNYLNKRISE